MTIQNTYAGGRPSGSSAPEQVEKLKAAAKAPSPPDGSDLNEEDTNTTIERSVPRMRGRFPMMPRDIRMDS